MEKDNYAIILDYGTLEVVILDLKDAMLRSSDCEDLLVVAKEQGLISHVSDCFIMVSEKLTIREEKLK